MNLDHVSDKPNELKQNENVAGSLPVPGVVSPQPYVIKITPPLPPLSQKIRDEFSFFGLAGLLYAVFFSFCLYKNISGITAPLFTLGTLIYFFRCLKKLEIKLNKDCIFYGAAIMLLGINLCTTDDLFIIFCDYMGIILILFSGLLSLFYMNNTWGLPEYLKAIFMTVFGSLEKGDRLFSDMKIWRKNRPKNAEKSHKTRYILYGVLIGLPISVTVLFLLSSADLVFGHLFERIFNLDSLFYTFYGKYIILDLFYIALLTIAIYILSYGLIVYLSSHSIKLIGGSEKKGEPLIAITVNAMLALIYIIFSVIQILYLFVGKMTLPEHYTYAEYARQGFFQLLLVCIINMVLVLICLYKFKENKVLKDLLTVISGCTYIMIASSVLRMYMYVKAYDLTYLRVLVLWTLGLLTFLMGGIILYIFKAKFPLFKYSMVVVTVLYLALAYSHPDYLIASCNLDENHISGNVDYRYLRGLSSDALPAVVAAIEREDSDDFAANFEGYFDHTKSRCDDHNVFSRMFFITGLGNSDKTSIRGFNFSRYRAGKYLEDWDIFRSLH